MKKLFSIILISLLLVISCDLFKVEEEKGNFWAVNAKTNRPYKVDAELLAEGTHCKIWVEKSSGVTSADAREIAYEYDNKIYDMMIDAFSIKNFPYGNKNFTNIMEFADWLGDGDGKLCILMLDIKDGYIADVTGYVAGYFRSYDFYSGLSSNKRDMIYIDTNPGFLDDRKKQAYATLAHEMQHMMNYATSIAKRGSNTMDLWIDEGLSSAAEWLYEEKQHTIERCLWINLDPSGWIRKGNNFFVWGNHDSEQPLAIHDEYATAYLFFQWLRLQSDDGDSIYKNIISSSYSDYRAVTNSAYYHNNDWETLLGDWLAANYINAKTGRYGYKDEPVLKNVKALPAPVGSTSITLYPGEGVYSGANLFTIPSKPLSGNIRYAGLDDTLIPSGPITGALLTYNANTSRTGSRETGTITGVQPVKSSMLMDMSSGSRSVQSSFLSGPYPIGIGDALRSNGYEFPVYDFSENIMGATIVE